jgi:hypothetical protein
MLLNEGITVATAQILCFNITKQPKIKTSTSECISYCTYNTNKPTCNILRIFPIKFHFYHVTYSGRHITLTAKHAQNIPYYTSLHNSVPIL